MTADLLFGAAELPKSLLNLLDGRRGFYILECVVVLFVGFACNGKTAAQVLSRQAECKFKPLKFLRNWEPRPVGRVFYGRLHGKNRQFL